LWKTDRVAEMELRRKLKRKFYFNCFTHGLIVLYGFAILIITFAA